MSKPLNLFVDCGSDYEKTIPLKQSNGNPIDLTGYTFLSQLRRHYTDTVAYNFTVTASGSPTLGVIKMAMAASVSETIPAGRYVYDVLAINGTTGAQVRLLEGVVDVTPRVTVEPEPAP